MTWKSVESICRYSYSCVGQTNVWLAITIETRISRTPLTPKTPKPGKTNSSSPRQTSPTTNRRISSWSAVPLRNRLQKKSRKASDRRDRRQADARHLHLEDQHEDADEEQDEADERVVERVHEPVDPGRPVDADRLAAEPVEALEVLLARDDLAEPEARGVVGRER